MDRKTAVLARLDIAGLIADLFPRRTQAGVNQVLVNCPKHDDATASCSVNTVNGLWNCKACGESGNVFDCYMARRGVDFATALHDLEERAGIAPPQAGSAKRRSAAHAASSSPAKPAAAKPKAKAKQAPAPAVKGRVVAVFRYRDAAGVVRYVKKRIVPGRDGRRKEFAFAHFLADDNEAPGRGDCPPLLYNLHRLAAAPPGETVFIVEGEGKADALAAWGLVAVCTDSGAAGRWPDGFNDLFTGRPVVILPDNDQPGEKYAAAVAALLVPVAASVKILRLPELPPKGDVLDWIAARRKGATDA